MIVLGFGVSGVSGCRWEVGKVPLPVPTPTPRPTPTPITLAVATNGSVSPTQRDPLAARVAAASADFFAAATTEALENAEAVRGALSQADGESNSLASALPQAKKSLAAAKQAYLKSEVTVFFVDPDSVGELRSQPDPFGASEPGAESPVIDQLQSALSELETLLDGPPGSSAAALLVKADSVSRLLGQTETGLRDMAVAWRRGAADSFRADYFLASSQGAVARVFQGLLAMTGDVLPAALSPHRSDCVANVAARVGAVRDIYLGVEENGPSLHALVQRSSPVQAALTRASLGRACALSSVLEIAPGNKSVEAQLAPALEDLTRQLTFAANSLGIVIVSQD